MTMLEKIELYSYQKKAIAAAKEALDHLLAKASVQINVGEFYAGDSTRYLSIDRAIGGQNSYIIEITKLDRGSVDYISRTMTIDSRGTGYFTELKHVAASLSQLQHEVYMGALQLLTNKQIEYFSLKSKGPYHYAD